MITVDPLILKIKQMKQLLIILQGIMIGVSLIESLTSRMKIFLILTLIIPKIYQKKTVINHILIIRIISIRIGLRNN